MTDAERAPREYDRIVQSWLTSALLPGKDTAFINPQTVLDAPLATGKAIRELVIDGHRVVIGRRPEK